MFDNQYWHRPGEASNGVYNFNGYNGGTYWGAPQYPSDSRRNIGTPSAANPVNPFNQYGQVGINNQAIPENMVQPCSTYPPSTPVGQLGLNAYVETRRNTAPVPGSAPQNNPWAPQSPVAAPAQPDCAACAYANNNGGYTNAWNYTVSSFDKKGVWNNQYTQAKQLDMPNVAWDNPQQNSGYNRYNYNTIGLNTNTFADHKPVDENWYEIATKNWSPESL